MNEIKARLFEKLTGAPALTALLAGTAAVYDSVAPEGSPFPYLVFNQQAAPSENLDANDRGSWHYQIQAIGTAGLQEAWKIAGQVDAIMQPTYAGGAGTIIAIQGFNTLDQRRTEWIEYVETDSAGKRYYHAGAIYRLWLTKV